MRINRSPAVMLTAALLVTLCAAWSAPLSAAQWPFGVNRKTAPDSARAKEALSLYMYTLEHQKAVDAMSQVEPLLSPRGSIELRPADNTLVVRDSLASLTRIIPVLRRFDHPPRTLAMDVMVVEANRIAFSPAIQEEDLPESLLTQFRKLLPYSTYRVLARAEVAPSEGQEVMYQMGGGFGLSFRMGTMLNSRNVRLHELRIARREANNANKQLVRTTLSLRLDQPYALTLTRSEESSTALMVVFMPKSSGPWKGR